MTTILGLESSCDETAAAVVEGGRRVLSNVIASQHDLHKRYRGVVPEIASRAHLEKLTPVVREAMDQACVRLEQLDAIAVGNRPGLIGSLVVGVSAAKALAWSLGVPLVGVDHVRAHLHAAWLVDASAGETAAEPEMTEPTPACPHLGLVVSGGHTNLYRIDGPGQLERIGRTIDDAIGEAYDKAGVILGLGYPGGPAIDRLAATGDPKAVDLPRSMLKPGSLDFSFSGLKTALLYAVRGHPVGKGANASFERSEADLTDSQRADLAASFQAAAVDAVVRKLTRAIKQLHGRDVQPSTLIVGGGVSANSHLRQRLGALGQRYGLAVHLPAMDHCVDNAAMIAGLAHVQLAKDGGDGLGLAAIATTAM